jgi:hypothetical protein
LAGLGLNGSVTCNTASQALLLLPTLGLGLFLGQHLFRYIAPHTAALVTQWLLLTIASLGLLGWWQS